MADRGRDLKVSILSDLDKFDLDPAANDLESLGRDAKSTAEKVDDAFDKIAKSSRSNFRKVDNDVDKAKKGLDDFKDEAHSTGREAAASFSGGFDDVADAIQETAANAFSGFGPIGAAAGLAAAAGIGFIVNKLEEIKAKINETAEAFRNIGKDANIDLPTERVKAFFDNMDIEELTKLKEGLAQAGISVEDYARALARGGPALDLMQEKIKNAYDAAGVFKGSLGFLVDETEYFEQGAKKGAEAGDLEAAALKAVAGSADKATAAMDRHNEALAQESEKAQTTADSIKGVGDAWSETTDAAEQSLTDLNSINQKRLDAMKEHKENLMAIAQEESSEFLEYMKTRPAEEVAAYVKGTEKEKAKYRKIWNEVGAVTMEGAASGMVSNKQKVVDAAAGIYRAASDQFGNPIIIGTKIDPPSAGEAARVRRLIANSIGDVPVNLVPKYGQGRYVP